MKRLAVGLAGAALAFAWAAAPAFATPAEAPPDDRGGLRTVTSSDERLTASYGHSTVAMSLESETAAVGRSRSAIQVNGTRLTADRDLVSGTSTWSGQGGVLSPAEHQGLVSLAAQVSKEWVAPAQAARRDLPEHTDLMVRLVLLAAEAPPGVTLGTRDVRRPATTQETRSNRARAAGTTKVTCVDAAVASTEDGSAARVEALAACQSEDEDGIAYMSCTRANRNLSHDADGHCFLTESVNSGPGSSECLGECGPGCNGIDTYTYDCGDHDRCGRAHGGSLNPWDAECGDEYFEADDDFLFAAVNRC